MSDKVFKYYQDAGHGWIAVKIKDIFDLGIQHKISQYSYIRGMTAFLEEDCDAPEFTSAWRAKHGDFKVEFKHQGDKSYIRYCDRWTYAAAEEVYKKIKGW